MKDDGNAKFKEKKLREAETSYRDGIAHLDTVKSNNEDFKKVKIALHQNLSLVLNQLGDFKDTI